MKGFARTLWAAGVLAGLLTGVQTLTAAPAPPPGAADCEVCYEVGDGLWMCYHIGCGEP
jgi:hypothetical protein